MTRRLSLTKGQRQTAAGMDLIALCTAAATDGRLSDEEVADLREWADLYRDVDLPARAHLDGVLARVFADGVLSASERVTLFDAIEAVLPPDVRKEVAAHRRTAASQDRRRDAVLYRYDFMVAGVRYHDRDLVCRSVNESTGILLCRERGNPFSPHATLVLTDDQRELGYVPDEEAANSLARQLDDGSLYSARVKKVLTGGRWPIPIILADVHWSDAKITGARRATVLDYRERPPQRARAPRSTQAGQGGGCALVVAAGMMAAGLLARA